MKATSFLVTGANGFVGKFLCAELKRRNFLLKAALRTSDNDFNNIEQVFVASINGATDWSAALKDIDVVIHLAARVHVMADFSADPLAEFRQVNVEGTRQLAVSAVRAGAKRFVYVSSIKANGEEADKPYTEFDKPNPHDFYGISKWEAEQAVYQVSAETGLQVVIVRPPLVYGAGVKGNFAQMIKIISKGIPLPFASVKNLRSFIYVENLVDALILCATHPSAAGHTYLVSDGEDVSTPELLNKLGKALAKPAHLFACHPSILRLAGYLTGKTAQVNRLVGSLQVDSSKIKQELGWLPPIVFADAINKMVEGLH